jgi:hypothetical protein
MKMPAARVAAFLFLLLVGCYPHDPAFDDGGSGGSSDAGGGSGGLADSGVSGAGGSDLPVAMGVPCAVQQLMVQRCQGCHGPVPRSPMSLVMRAHFVAPSVSTPAESVGQRSLARMRDSNRPMPPSGLLPASELTAFEQWVRAGFPVGVSCDGPDAGPMVDGGTGDVDGGLLVDAGALGDGLPCAVEDVLTQACRSCHAAMPRAGAPMPLLSRSHFVAPSSNASLSVGALSIRRMRDMAAPMPPGGILPSTQIAAVEMWVNAGMPAARCVNAVDAGPDPYAGPVQCTSGRSWSGGNRGSQHMNPGRACISCHTGVNAAEGEEKAPAQLGGTVFPTGREPDLCLGIPGSATVVLTGADSAEVRLPVNASGNFYLWSTSRLAKPYRARIEYQGRTRRMSTPQMSGDCNSCHTVMGRNGAPGRLVVP